MISSERSPPRIRVAVLAIISAVAYIQPSSADQEIAFSPTRDIECPNANTQTNNLYFGDLHSHTSYSMDAYIQEVRTTPWDLYAFAKGGPIGLAPLDVNGEPTRTRILPPGRALDFAAVTDHSEYLAEVSLCTDPALVPDAYNASACITFREDDQFRQFRRAYPDRLPEICDVGDQGCANAYANVWQDMISAANTHNTPCEFTAFIGYEWSGSIEAANVHRNVIFRSDQVPASPQSAYISDDPQNLWDALDLDCPVGSGCEAIIIPHNTNLSQGLSLKIDYPDGATTEQQQTLAAQRERLERLLEITQHKGTSECLPGYSNDEFCEFELAELQNTLCELYPAPGGQCLTEIDTYRGALKAGLLESERIGINPIKLGAMASTDSHNSTAGDVAEDDFVGHGGSKDSTPLLRLTEGRVWNSPGGLIAAWASQNTRDSIFDAMHRRETYATSGPRIAVRFFAGPYLQQSDCETAYPVRVAYKKGVPMGGELKDRLVSRMNLMVTVMADEVPIENIQIVKGYIDENGDVNELVLEDNDLKHSVDDQSSPSCAEEGVDCEPLCGVIEDVDFRPRQPAFYYLRVLEYATPRWSSYDCDTDATTASQRACTPGGNQAPRFIKERAWTSPIWYEPSM